MRVRLRIDHPHAYREWEAWPVHGLPGFFHCKSVIVVDQHYRQHFSQIFCERDLEILDDIPLPNAK